MDESLTPFAADGFNPAIDRRVLKKWNNRYFKKKKFSCQKKNSDLRRVLVCSDFNVVFDHAHMFPAALAITPKRSGKQEENKTGGTAPGIIEPGAE